MVERHYTEQEQEVTTSVVCFSAVKDAANSDASLGLDVNPTLVYTHTRLH